jgi:cyclase
MKLHHSLVLLLSGLVLIGCGNNADSTTDGSSQVDPTSDSSSHADSSSDGSSHELQAFPACEGPFTITAPNPMLPWTPNAIRLVSEELAPGVFAVYDDKANEYAPKGIPLATSGGFVIGDNGVLLVESMINRQLFCQLIDLVRAETDKPITHVINTSSHGDHSYGNMFLPEDVNVVQHENTAAYIAQYFAEDLAFMTTNFGTDQGLSELKPVAADTRVTNDGLSIDLGNMVVEAKYFGFGQTPGDLFVRVPSAKVLWTGNPLLSEKPGIPWLLDGHAEEVAVTLAAVKAASPADTIVVPGHGRPIGVDGFDFSVGYLNALISEVNTAVSAGKTVEEATAEVTMQDFQGYALWDWIHKTVNVPKTYQELKP